MYNFLDYLSDFELNSDIFSLRDEGIFIDYDAGDSHKYIYAFRFYPIGEMDSSINSYFIESDADVQVVFFYYDEEENILRKDILKSAQVFQHSFPNGISYIDVYFRLVGKGEKVVSAILIGEMNEISRSISNKVRFLSVFDEKEEVGFRINEKHIFVLETIFCDTEDRDFIMDRYFSFIMAQVNLFLKVKNKNVFWFVHFSDDKRKYIDDFYKKVLDLGLQYNIYINEYTHPKEGYGNENETNIDRIIKPNATYPKLRDDLFNKALIGFLEKTRLDLNSDNVFIRGVLDDDDFLNSSVFFSISKEVDRIFNEVSDDPFLMINKNIKVSYFSCYSSRIVVDKVRFKRAVCGCKYSVSKGVWPIHPFSIDESVGDKLMAYGKEMLVYDISSIVGVAFSYSYNRHFLNLSNARKNFFYEHFYETIEYKHHDDFSNDFLIF